MYKAVFMDLDGTLLNSKSEIDIDTKNVLLEAQKRGILVVLASGRVSSSTIQFANEIGLNGYIISGNGSVITNIDTNEDIYTNCMNKDTVLKIIDICEENSIYYNLYTLKEIYTKNLLYSTLFYNYENRRLPAERKVKINICADIKKMVQNSQKTIISKITICNEHKSIFNSIIRKLRDIQGVDVLDVSHSSRKNLLLGTKNVEINYYYTEVSKENVNKWSAIEYLINKLDIQAEEIITIGDNANDIQMVKNAGLGVIMGNAASVYKEQADFVTNTNDNNGVKEVIDKFILKDI